MYVTPPRGTQRTRSWTRFLCFASSLVAALFAPAAARADVTTLDGTQSPIVRINVRQGDVTVRTWERHSVAIDGDASLSIERRLTHQPFAQNPVLIPPAAQSSKDGPVLLPAEGFVVSSIPPGPREAIFIKAGPAVPAGPVIVTMPSDAVYVFAYARNGNLDVHDYRGGTLVAFTGRGRLSLEGVGGTIFAQTGRGALTVADSNLDRVRARSLFGNMTFERCRARQIEATSVNGSIVYDSGTFDAGLAHFESVRGNIAIGTLGAAQVAARTAGEGRVFTNFERGAGVEGGKDRTSATVGTSGPVVTAVTQGGNVFLYDGTLRTRDRLSNQWQAPLATLQRPSMHARRPEAGLGRPAQPFENRPKGRARPTRRTP